MLRLKVLAHAHRRRADLKHARHVQAEDQEESRQRVVEARRLQLKAPPLPQRHHQAAQRPKRKQDAQRVDQPVQHHLLPVLPRLLHDAHHLDPQHREHARHDVQDQTAHKGRKHHKQKRRRRGDLRRQPPCSGPTGGFSAFFFQHRQLGKHLRLGRIRCRRGSHGHLDERLLLERQAALVVAHQSIHLHLQLRLSRSVRRRRDHRRQVNHPLVTLTRQAIRALERMHRRPGHFRHRPALWQRPHQLRRLADDLRRQHLSVSMRARRVLHLHRHAERLPRRCRGHLRQQRRRHRLLRFLIEPRNGQPLRLQGEGCENSKQDEAEGAKTHGDGNHTWRVG